MKLSGSRFPLPNDPDVITRTLWWLADHPVFTINAIVILLIILLVIFDIRLTNPY